jgi:hypothetical protein
MNCYNINIIRSNNIDYFLFTRNKFLSILQNLKESLNSHYELREYNGGFLDVCKTKKNKDKEEEIIICKNNISIIDKEINSLEEDIKAMEEQLLSINKKIQHICVHDFVEDYIDIDPDRSIKIVYCQVCEYTKG